MLVERAGGGRSTAGLMQAARQLVPAGAVGGRVCGAAVAGGAFGWRVQNPAGQPWTGLTREAGGGRARRGSWWWPAPAGQPSLEARLASGAAVDNAFGPWVACRRMVDGVADTRGGRAAARPLRPAFCLFPKNIFAGGLSKHPPAQIVIMLAGRRPPVKMTICASSELLTGTEMGFDRPATTNVFVA